MNHVPHAHESQLMSQYRDDGFTITALFLTVVLLTGCGEQNSDSTQATPTNDTKVSVLQSEEQAPAGGTYATALVTAAMTGVNPWAMSATDLAVMENPKGEGQFVYIPQVQERLGRPANLLWVVVGGQAYAVNGPSKNLTPGLTWPREAPEGVWNTTGLDPFIATDTIRLVFGDESPSPESFQGRSEAVPDVGDVADDIEEVAAQFSVHRRRVQASQAIYEERIARELKQLVAAVESSDPEEYSYRWSVYSTTINEVILTYKSLIDDSRELQQSARRVGRATMAREMESGIADMEAQLQALKEKQDEAEAANQQIQEKMR